MLWLVPEAAPTNSKRSSGTAVARADHNAAAVNANADMIVALRRDSTEEAQK